MVILIIVPSSFADDIDQINGTLSQHTLNATNASLKSSANVVSDCKKADSETNKGSNDFNQGRYSLAMQEYDNALSLCPDNYKAWQGKGRILERDEKYNDALNAYDTSLNFDPNNTRTLTMKGSVLIQLERYEEALAVLDKAINLGANYHDTVNLKEIAQQKILKGKESSGGSPDDQVFDSLVNKTVNQVQTINTMSKNKEWEKIGTVITEYKDEAEKDMKTLKNLTLSSTIMPLQDDFYHLLQNYLFYLNAIENTNTGVISGNEGKNNLDMGLNEEETFNAYFKSFLKKYEDVKNQVAK
jgi:tetratricopeptide (TPR) repeat protein